MKNAQKIYMIKYESCEDRNGSKNSVSGGVPVLIILFYLYQKSKTYFISWCRIAVNLTLLCCAPLDFAGDSFIVETRVEMSVEASVISSVKSSLISSGP